MGADNWAVCPNCLKKAEEKWAALQARCVEEYGKIAVEEYLALREAASIPIDHDAVLTFREDYEIGVDSEGSFSVSYSGHCNACDLYFAHKIDIPVNLKLRYLDTLPKEQRDAATQHRKARRR